MLQCIVPLQIIIIIIICWFDRLFDQAVHAGIAVTDAWPMLACTRDGQRGQLAVAGGRTPSINTGAN